MIRKNSISESNKDLSGLKKINKVRPNIDHLIKRILVEKRKEKARNHIIFAVIFLGFAGYIASSLFN